MFRIWLRIVGILTALQLGLGGGSASAEVGKGSAEDSAWAQASQRNTLGAYAEFVIAHPESKYVQLAYARLATVGTVNPNGHGIPAIEASPDVPISKPKLVPNWKLAS